MLFIGVWGRFGWFHVFLGLGVDIEGFLFCWEMIFGLFLDLVGVLKLWYCIVVAVLGNTSTNPWRKQSAY